MDIQFNLRDRVVLIAGPFSGNLQNIMLGITQMGADVAIVDREGQQATKFCQNLMDQREVNDKYGRAMAIKADLNDKKQMKDAVGNVAQTFGSLDIFIDAHLVNTPAPMEMAGADFDFDSMIQTNLKIPMELTNVIVPYLKGRKRGRIVYMVNGSIVKGSPSDLLISAMRGGLTHFAKGLAQQTVDLNMTVNVLSLGLTEEYILGHYPESKSIRETFDKIKLADPSARMTEPDRVTNSVLYLISQFGVGITGQVISL